MSRKLAVILSMVVVLAAAGVALAQPAPSRGELLYANHCGGCHGEKLHWRDKRAATDWPTLKGQVALWQEREKLNWSDEDITEVARHLNDTIYRFPRDSGQVALAAARAR